MDSQLYIVINANIQLGQTISKELAQKGNTVIYLGENEQEGYAITADEPRVRYRYCSIGDRTAIAKEFDWTKRNVAPIDGIVVLVAEGDIQGMKMPLEEEYFVSLLDGNNTSVGALPLTYVIVPDAKSDSDTTLKTLHLNLCELSHQERNPSHALKVNHVVVSGKQHTHQKCANMASNASDLIHYLSSQHAKAIQRQAFYFANSFE